MDNTKLVQALAKCIEACGICATSCLNEDDVAKMKECIATDLDCADVCSVTLQLLSRKSKHLDAQLTTCITICEGCEETCRATIWSIVSNVQKRVKPVKKPVSLSYP